MHLAFYAILFTFLGWAVWTDLRSRLIPNRIPLAVVLLFFLAAWSGVVDGIWMHLAVFAAVLAVSVALFALGILGGGDAKLIPAVSLWAGSDRLVPFLVVMTLTGGLLALLLLVRRRLSEASSDAHAGSVPYAVAIAAGAIAIVSEPVVNAFPASFLEILRSGA
ncbi:MAG: prepilin peptidase [Rhodothalassiaceae bacterium]